MVKAMGSSMSWLLVALSSGSAGAALWWALKMRGRLNQIQQKYAPALQIDKYVKEQEEIADNLKRRAEQDRNKLKYELDDLRIKYEETKGDLVEIEAKLSLSQEEFALQDYGYYEPNYEFEASGDWDEELKNINERIKE
jgi:hypothetical protein